MCGLAGIWGTNADSIANIYGMTRSLKHRGPDDEGFWLDPEVQIAMGHRRLSIIDISPAGAQPMVSYCGRYVLVFNGEIYNHLEIRSELNSSGLNPCWRGTSDTETLLALISARGARAALEILNGMFAFAVWDRNERTLTLARDRMGEKPLYYGQINRHFVFGSELKALYAHANWSPEIDRDSLALFMRYNHVPAPRTIFMGVFKLPPAHYLVLTNPNSTADKPVCYWDLDLIVDNRNDHKIERYEDLTFEVETLLKTSVNRRMLSDRPVGAFLSGGYDSTMIVAQMQSMSARPIKTFTIGNLFSEFDEAKHSAEVAKHLGTDHIEHHISVKDALSIITGLPSIYDEPFADSSQIPTYLVSQLAKQHVSVVLSGDGGDELFGGYNRYVTGGPLWSVLNKLPYFCRILISDGLDSESYQSLHRSLNGFSIFSKIPGLELKLKKVLLALRAGTEEEFYDCFRTHWSVNDIVLGSSRLVSEGSVISPKGLTIAEKMMFWDAKTYLPDDILTKLDRASMAVSLEARAPFLDHRLVEFSWRIPLRHKIRNGKGKCIIRDLVHKYVPQEIMDRPKQGFGVPLADWLRGPLRDWAEALLEGSRLRGQGFLNPNIVKKAWDDHYMGMASNEHELWCVLMFQSWLEAYESKERPSAIA